MISIVMGFYDRHRQLERTLKTIKKSLIEDYEVIVVDDASEIPFETDEEKVRVIRIEKKDKWWVNPCIAYNIGFKEAKGDVIIIQNPECCHEGDVLLYVANNIEKGTYLSISCLETDQKMSALIEKELHNLNWSDITKGWMNHPYYNPINFHFCTAIMKSDLDMLGGFDERYARGIAFDDTEFIRRIYRKGMKILSPEYPFVIHQYHDRGHWNNPALLERNRKLYEKEYLKGEKDRLTEQIKPKPRPKQSFRLGVSYNVFDGTELLRDSILSIRDSVDHISVVYQDISNMGNAGDPGLTDLIMDLVHEGLVDDVMYYIPDLTQLPSTNEINKRNMGYINSYEHACTHHISMDVDEFYEKEQFREAKKIIYEKDFDSSACHLLTYYKNNTTIVWPPESYYVPFIYKIRPGLMYSRMVWPVTVDPTRRIAPGNIMIFEDIVMHHFSYVRKDLVSKLKNSSANSNFTPSGTKMVIEHFENWKPGDKALFAPFAYFGTRQIDPKFLLTWDF
jgi:glycosyltransferase involved in cell wall biosynthesis